MELSQIGLLCEPVTPPYVEPISPETNAASIDVGDTFYNYLSYTGSSSSFYKPIEKDVLYDSSSVQFISNHDLKVTNADWSSNESHCKSGEVCENLSNSSFATQNRMVQDDDDARLPNLNMSEDIIDDLHAVECDTRTVVCHDEDFASCFEFASHQDLSETNQQPNMINTNESCSNLFITSSNLKENNVEKKSQNSHFSIDFNSPVCQNVANDHLKFQSNGTEARYHREIHHHRFFETTIPNQHHSLNPRRSFGANLRGNKSDYHKLREFKTLDHDWSNGGHQRIQPKQFTTRHKNGRFTDLRGFLDNSRHRDCTAVENLVHSSDQFYERDQSSEFNQYYFDFDHKQKAHCHYDKSSEDCTHTHPAEKIFVSRHFDTGHGISFDGRPGTDCGYFGGVQQERHQDFARQGQEEYGCHSFQRPTKGEHILEHADNLLIDVQHTSHVDEMPIPAAESRRVVITSGRGIKEYSKGRSKSYSSGQQSQDSERSRERNNSCKVYKSLQDQDERLHISRSEHEEGNDGDERKSMAFLKELCIENESLKELEERRKSLMEACFRSSSHSRSKQGKEKHRKKSRSRKCRSTSESFEGSRKRKHEDGHKKSKKKKHKRHKIDKDVVRMEDDELDTTAEKDCKSSSEITNDLSENMVIRNKTETLNLLQEIVDENERELLQTNEHSNKNFKDEGTDMLHFGIETTRETDDEECSKVEDEECSKVKDEECSKVNDEKCSNVHDDEECSEVEDEECSEVEDEECSKVEDEECSEVDDELLVDEESESRDENQIYIKNKSDIMSENIPDVVTISSTKTSGDGTLCCSFDNDDGVVNDKQTYDEDDDVQVYDGIQTYGDDDDVQVYGEKQTYGDLQAYNGKVSEDKDAIIISSSASVCENTDIIASNPERNEFDEDDEDDIDVNFDMSEIINYSQTNGDEPCGLQDEVANDESAKNLEKDDGCQSLHVEEKSDQEEELFEVNYIDIEDADYSIEEEINKCIENDDDDIGGEESEITDENLDGRMEVFGEKNDEYDRCESRVFSKLSEAGSYKSAMDLRDMADDASDLGSNENSESLCNNRICEIENSGPASEKACLDDGGEASMYSPGDNSNNNDEKISVEENNEDEDVRYSPTDEPYNRIEGLDQEELYSYSPTENDKILKKRSNRHEKSFHINSGAYIPDHIPGLSPIASDSSPQAYTPTSQTSSVMGDDSPSSPASPSRLATASSSVGLPDLMQLLVQTLNGHSSSGHSNNNNMNLFNNLNNNDLLQQLLTRFQSIYKPSQGQTPLGQNGLMAFSTNPLLSLPFLLQSQKSISPTILHYLSLQSLSTASRGPSSDLDPLVKGNESTRLSYSPFDINTVSPRSEEAMSFSPPSLTGACQDDRPIPAERRSPEEASKSLAVEKRVKASTKIELQQKLVIDIKELLRPVFKKGRIDKEDYKDILRKTVPKILSMSKLSYNRDKIAKFTEAYIQKVIATKKYHNRKVANMT